MALAFCRYAVRRILTIGNGFIRGLSLRELTYGTSKRIIALLLKIQAEYESQFSAQLKPSSSSGL